MSVVQSAEPHRLPFRRRRGVLSAAVVVGVSLGISQLAFVQGAAHAASDQFRGQRMLYQLGCVIGPSSPRDPVSYRFEELLRTRYALHFETTGGFAPSESTLRFVSGYNHLSWWLMVGRFGSTFLDRTMVEAKRDLIVRNVVLRGCYARGELQVPPSSERVHVIPGRGLPEGALLSESDARPVVIVGSLTEVRAGAWNRELGRIISAENIQRDPKGVCEGTR